MLIGGINVIIMMTMLMTTVTSTKVSIHTASRIDTWLGLVGLGLGLASQASRVYLLRMAIHMATGEASRVYSISVLLPVCCSYYVYTDIPSVCSVCKYLCLPL